MEFFIDTNSLIELEKFRPSIFVGVWDNIYEMIDNKELYSVTDVLNELKEKNDPDDNVLIRWGGVTGFFLESGPNENDIISDIMSDPAFEVFRSRAIGRGSWADPHLIAFAESKGGIVVTNESIRSNPERKIPYVCQAREVMCMNLIDMMEYLEWEFVTP